MRLLLDAHAFLWWVTDSPKLAEAARDAVGDDNNDVTVGIGTLWEIAIKRSLGKLQFPFDFETVLRDENFGVLPITYAHLRALDSLPQLHRDPFDRLLIAQSLVDGLTLVTVDARLRAYGAAILW